jgi:hypothetical protein
MLSLNQSGTESKRVIGSRAGGVDFKHEYMG